MMQPRFLGQLIFFALLGACASASEDYPSLAMRDSERITGTMAVAEPASYEPAPTAQTALESLAVLNQQARAAHAEFVAAAPAASRTAQAARNAGVGTQAWSDAQVAIAELESQRGQLLIALADLDRIYVSTSNAGEAIAPVAEVRNDIAALAEEENAVISELLQLVR